MVTVYEFTHEGERRTDRGLCSAEGRSALRTVQRLGMDENLYNAWFTDQKTLGLKDDDALMDVIEKTLMEGKKDPNDVWAYIKYFTVMKDGKLRVYQLRVIMSNHPDRVGWIANARVVRIITFVVGGRKYEKMHI